MPLCHIAGRVKFGLKSKNKNNLLKSCDKLKSKMSKYMLLLVATAV